MFTFNIELIEFMEKKSEINVYVDYYDTVDVLLIKIEGITGHPASNIRLMNGSTPLKADLLIQQHWNLVAHLF